MILIIITQSDDGNNDCDEMEFKDFEVNRPLIFATANTYIVHTIVLEKELSKLYQAGNSTEQNVFAFFYGYLF